MTYCAIHFSLRQHYSCTLLLHNASYSPVTGLPSFSLLSSSHTTSHFFCFTSQSLCISLFCFTNHLLSYSPFSHHHLFSHQLFLIKFLSSIFYHNHLSSHLTPTPIFPFYSFQSICTSPFPSLQSSPEYVRIRELSYPISKTN